ncbi:CYFA0S03e01706g1_1 [Cyberlindnera fabianii]|uniref:Cytosolic Fe-S cluster assembly factor NAR1 n=1 Tax=Cyberlindnera fabianii TaxID=36022 RepID=A0A061AX45_CYBFA|nr:Cytosolic Fe-S cluster assembly factor NAR1 [Cyberlindnera fabianii]CDR39284.1 CYFA0S03e01706g1_1 [Cyberlindnera fabianii]
MSAILSEADLNDFISPGLACIKPAGEVRASATKRDGQYEIQIGDEGAEAFEVSVDDGTVNNLETANISLQDCLACSGCITSAEEVLLAKQTHKVLIDDLNKHKDDKVFALSLSHQSRVSIAVYLNVPTYKVDELLINLFSERYGFRFVVGTELSRLISISQINQEVIQSKLSGQSKPYLSSICPGFVLYVEKTKPEILPYLLNVKSPQQITGQLLKSLISKQLNIPYSSVYHLSIMPCFDKKLEAARPEDEVDVDCVLTPKELVELIKDEAVNVNDYITNNDAIPTHLYKQAAPQHWPFAEEAWSSHIGSASGGYAENYIIALQQYYQTQGVATELKEVKGKNTDVVEYQLINESGEKLGSSAVVNGFRNIQNLVRKLKPTGKVKIGSGLAARRKARQKNKKDTEIDAVADPSSCDFVEVMACPGGCINGGGVNNGGTSVNNKELVSNLLAKYYQLPQADNLNDEAFLKQFVSEFMNAFGVSHERFYNYKFSVIEKATDILSVGSKW